MMEEIKNETEEVENLILMGGDNIRKDLVNKLFNLNTLLSATFIILYQLKLDEKIIKILNILPFITIFLILIYHIINLQVLGYAYYNLNNPNKSFYKELLIKKHVANKIIYISIALTIIEIGYILRLFLR